MPNQRYDWFRMAPLDTPPRWGTPIVDCARPCRDLRDKHNDWTTNLQHICVLVKCEPVMVGFVWNFSHKLTMITKAAMKPMTVKQNHMNLFRNSRRRFWVKSTCFNRTENHCHTFRQMDGQFPRYIAHHATWNCWKTPASDRADSCGTSVN